MQVLIVIVSAGGVAFLGATTVFLLHRDGRVQHGPVHATARVVDHELAAHRGLATFVRERLDPRRATGLALTIALLLLVIVGVLAFEVRRQSFVVHADVDVARWAASHATDVSTRVLRDFTHLGSSVVILAITVTVAIVEVRRTGTRGVVLFLAVTVIGANVATNLVKLVVERARPDIAPLAGLSGYSFPSGHSSGAAACFAACALCLGRRRSVGTRLVLTAVATALAVMVATSRVLLGVHWTSDAFAGLCFGAAWFTLCSVAFGGRLLRFGAPVEAATRVHAASVVEIAHAEVYRGARNDAGDGHRTHPREGAHEA